MPLINHIKLIEKIDAFIKEESGEVILKIQPKKFNCIYNEESGQIVLNEILNMLGFDPIEDIENVLADECFIKENI